MIGPAKLQDMVELLAKAPGLASLRAARIGATVFAFHGAASVPAPDRLLALRSRGFLAGDTGASGRMKEGGVIPDLELFTAGEPDCPVSVGAALQVQGGAAPVLLLPEECAWLSDVLGHGACCLPGNGDNLLLAALAVGPAELVWTGPPPAGHREILAGVRMNEPGRTVLVDRRSPRWFPGQGQVDLDVVGVAWKPFDRKLLTAALQEAIAAGPSPFTDLVPGAVARAALPDDWHTGNWVSPHHAAWLRFGAMLHRALEGSGTLQTDQDEAEKYQVFWDDGHASGHTSPGERVYPLVREYIRALGCRTFLDIGCGCGEVLEGAERDGLVPHGLDIADGLIDTPRARFRDRLTLGSAWNMPFADRSIDFIFSSDVFEHLPPSRLPATLDELARVCRKGAALAISARADFSGLKWGALLHLSVFPLEYWKEELGKRFDLPYAVEVGKEDNPHYILLLRRKESASLAG